MYVIYSYISPFSYRMLNIFLPWTSLSSLFVAFVCKRQERKRANIEIHFIHYSNDTIPVLMGI